MSTSTSFASKPVALTAPLSRTLPGQTPVTFDDQGAFARKPLQRLAAKLDWGSERAALVNLVVAASCDAGGFGISGVAGLFGASQMTQVEILMPIMCSQLVILPALWGARALVGYAARRQREDHFAKLAARQQ
jgi:hypothetical protein